MVPSRDLAEIVVIAVAGRALAQSAAKIGVPLRVLDAFADADTRALGETVCVGAGGVITLDPTRLLEALDRLPAQPGRRAIVVGSGFERTPEALERLGGYGWLCANAPDLVAALKQPELATELLRAIGWQVPQTRRTPPADPRGWLQKEVGGAGGVHIRRADRVAGHDNAYYQRELSGRPMSATFLADAERAFILGFNQQSFRAVGDAPFCYSGASTCEVPAALAASMQERLDRLVRVTGVRGLNGLDFLLDGGTATILEINPRPSATFELYDEDFAEGLVDWHIRSFGPEPVSSFAERLRERRGCHRAYAVMYAQQRLRVPGGMQFPSWCRDLPVAGSVIVPGAPVLSVFASGEGAVQAQRELQDRDVEVRALLAHWTTDTQDAWAA